MGENQKSPSSLNVPKRKNVVKSKKFEAVTAMMNVTYIVVESLSDRLVMCQRRRRRPATSNISDMLYDKNGLIGIFPSSALNQYIHVGISGSLVNRCSTKRLGEFCACAIADT